MPITLNGDTGIQTPMYNGTISSNAVTPSVNMKSRIINGAMVIDQRNAGASVTPTASTYTLDRWNAILTQASKYSIQQNAGSVTPPAGFTNYLGITSTSAYSVTASDFFLLGQAIEGFNIADLGWGAANAKTITISFWVRSSLTGTFGATLTNSAGARFYPFTYTISSANTWEQKSVTIAGDTSGTWLTNNGIGIYLYFGLGVGSNNSTTAGAWTSAAGYGVTGATSVVGTNGATFYITGVQLEVGSTATSFDYRPYGTELALCQRYFYIPLTTQSYSYVGIGRNTSTTQSAFVYTLPVSMRTIPSINAASVQDAVTGATGTLAITTDGSTNNTVGALANYSSGAVTTNAVCVVRMNNTTATPQFSAEL